ncbi:MAG: terpene cyclase/mutase family protein [Clostridiales bacterium]|nr:terpene cyclase/mutase family protein [Clostridiales bacterium]MCF8022855.1 terpene cyclase/mutase family protein [Clostridiales bacterium]
MVNQDEINNAVDKGITWLKSQQNINGSFGKWGPGSTGLAVLALLQGMPDSDPAVRDAVNYILEYDPGNFTYFRSIGVMALTAVGDQSSSHYDKVQSDVDWLVQAQGNDPLDKRTYGGWGQTNESKAADGSSTHYVILALYSAVLWGIDIPRHTWDKAVNWYENNYEINKNGSFVYSLDSSNKSITQTMTAAALTSLKIAKLMSSDPGSISRAKNLINSAVEWLEKNAVMELNLQVPGEWYYYHLYSFCVGCCTAPYYISAANSDWYTDMAVNLMELQEPEGKWVSTSDKKSAGVVHTSFAVLALASYAFAVPSKITYTGAVTAMPGKKVVMKAKLTDSCDNPLPGKEVYFYLTDFSSLRASTGDDGVAKTVIFFKRPPGNYNLTSVFFGDKIYMGCKDIKDLSVNTKMKRFMCTKNCQVIKFNGHTCLSRLPRGRSR